MALWTDLISPAELTGFARAAVEDVERQKGTLARWLPNYSVPDVVVRTVVAADGNGALAQFRAFDAETPIGSGGSGTRKVFELLPLGLKERVSEYDQLRSRGDSSQALVLGGVEKAATRVANAVVDRLEVARGQAIDSGALTINENGVVQTMSFGRPGGNTVTAATLWNAAGTPKPIDDLIAWCDVFADGNQGQMPGAIVTSRKVVAALQRSADIRSLAATMAGTPAIVSVDALNAILAGYGLPPIYVYDRKIRGTAVFYGETLESGEPDYGIGGGDQPGLVVGAWKTKDPIAVWVHSNAIALPVLVNPVASMVATVVS